MSGGKRGGGNNPWHGVVMGGAPQPRDSSPRERSPSPFAGVPLRGQEDPNQYRVQDGVGRARNRNNYGCTPPGSRAQSPADTRGEAARREQDRPGPSARQARRDGWAPDLAAPRQRREHYQDGGHNDAPRRQDNDRQGRNGGARRFSQHENRYGGGPQARDHHRQPPSASVNPMNRVSFIHTLDNLEAPGDDHPQHQWARDNARRLGGNVSRDEALQRLPQQQEDGAATESSRTREQRSDGRTESGPRGPWTAAIHALCQDIKRESPKEHRNRSAVPSRSSRSSRRHTEQPPQSVVADVVELDDWQEVTVPVADHFPTAPLIPEDNEGSETSAISTPSQPLAHPCQQMDAASVQMIQALLAQDRLHFEQAPPHYMNQPNETHAVQQFPQQQMFFPPPGILPPQQFPQQMAFPPPGIMAAPQYPQPQPLFQQYHVAPEVEAQHRARMEVLAAKLRAERRKIAELEVQELHFAHKVKEYEFKKWQEEFEAKKKREAEQKELELQMKRREMEKMARKEKKKAEKARKAKRAEGKAAEPAVERRAEPRAQQPVVEEEDVIVLSDDDEEAPRQPPVYLSDSDMEEEPVQRSREVAHKPVRNERRTPRFSRYVDETWDEIEAHRAAREPNPNIPSTSAGPPRRERGRPRNQAREFPLPLPRGKWVRDADGIQRLRDSDGGLIFKKPEPSHQIRSTSSRPRSHGAAGKSSNDSVTSPATRTSAVPASVLSASSSSAPSSSRRPTYSTIAARSSTAAPSSTSSIGRSGRASTGRPVELRRCEASEESAAASDTPAGSAAATSSTSSTAPSTSSRHSTGATGHSNATPSATSSLTDRRCGGHASTGRSRGVTDTSAESAAASSTVPLLILASDIPAGSTAATSTTPSTAPSTSSRHPTRPSTGAAVLPTATPSLRRTDRSNAGHPPNWHKMYGTSDESEAASSSIPLPVPVSRISTSSSTTPSSSRPAARLSTGASGSAVAAPSANSSLRRSNRSNAGQLPGRFMDPESSEESDAAPLSKKSKKD